MAKATFTVGVFGLACWNDNGTLRIKVNVRTDQERQRQIAGLPADSTVKIIDMPGGGVEFEDFPDLKSDLFFSALRREIAEETGGCETVSLGDWSSPYFAIINNQAENRPTGDAAFWMPVLLLGHPQPTDEALEHPWISLDQLDAEQEYRAVGGLGKQGRTGRMLKEAFGWFQKWGVEGMFSTPQL